MARYRLEPKLLKQQQIKSYKGKLWLDIFLSAETVHLILLCYLDDAIRCAVSADLKMVARNRTLKS